MTQEQHNQQELSPEELEQQSAAELPSREAMSLIRANPVLPEEAPLMWEQAIDPAPSPDNHVLPEES